MGKRHRQIASALLSFITDIFSSFFFSCIVHVSALYRKSLHIVSDQLYHPSFAVSLTFQIPEIKSVAAKSTSQT